MQMKNNCYQNGRITLRTVVKNEIDELGHVNNAKYVKWIQDAATEHWFSVSSEELKQKYIWFCLRHEIDCKKQLYENEKIEIRTQDEFMDREDIYRAVLDHFGLQKLTALVRRRLDKVLEVYF